jgi:acyl-CoA hydrolase
MIGKTIRGKGEKMEPVLFTTHHLVKSEDLNHHGTLYAGRTAEWFVESGFIAATSITKPENIVCLKIHGMSFTRPVKRGEIATFESRIVLTGTSRMIAYIQLKVRDLQVVQGFITFVNVDLEGKTLPHGVTITPVKPEDIALHEQAKLLT